MIKKYLTTLEEVLALKDTDTKIYTEGDNGYYQFVQGVFVRFNGDGSFALFCGFGFGNNYTNKYILVEEPIKEATEQDIGYLCYFYEDDTSLFLGVLDEIDEEGLYSRKGGCAKWTHCRRLTAKEVAEITGYKVEEN